MRWVAWALGLWGMAPGMSFAQTPPNAAGSRTRAAASARPTAAAPALPAAAPRPVPPAVPPAPPQPAASRDADDDGTPFRIPNEGTRGIVLSGLVGGGGSAVESADLDPIIKVGVDAIYYHDWVEAGLGVSGGWLLGPTSSFVSALGGGKVDAQGFFRLELLAEAAAHFVSGLGNGLFSNAQHTRVITLPYAGGRLGLTFLLGSQRRLLLGSWFSLGHDLIRETVTVPVQSCFLGCSVDDDTFRVGGLSWSLAFRIGGVIGKF